MNNRKVLALFDFDGTISHGDSLVKFLPYMVGFPRFLWGIFVLSPILVAYAFKLLPNYKAKEKAFIHFFKNWDENKFIQKARIFSLEIIPQLVKKEALNQIKWHLDQQHRIILISASMKYWLEPWCQQQGMECIATELEIFQGKITGRFASKNCYAIEKVKRLKSYLKLDDYQEIYAYGDSRGDREMLELAQHPFYKPFQN